MSSQDSGEQDSECLCKAFVPKEKRVDFIAPRPDKKTGKLKATVYLRYHQDCPLHGIHPPCEAHGIKHECPEA